MTIRILKKEILTQHDWEQHPAIEEAKASGGTAYRIEFDYDGHRAIMLTTVSKEFETDSAIALDDIFLMEAEMWVKSNPPA